MQKMIEDFWDKSINGKTSEFDFDAFFAKFEEALTDKLARHGQLTLEHYIECMKEYYDLEALRNFTYKGKHSKIDVTYEQVVSSVFFKRYHLIKEKYLGNERYQEMFLVWRELRKVENLILSNKVLLVDRCIHLMHNSGYLIENLGEIKANYEKALLNRLSYDKLFGILTRNAVEMKMEELGTVDCVVLDFNNMSKRNAQWGYDRVNKTMFEIFREYKEKYPDVVVGRWFSGDEIILIGVEPKLTISLNALRIICENHSMSFSTAFFGQVKSPKELDEKLSEKRMR